MMNTLNEIFQILANWFQTGTGILVVSLCTILGIFLSIALALLSRKLRSPRFMIRTVPLEWSYPAGVFSPTLARMWAAKMKRRQEVRDKVLKIVRDAAGKEICLTSVAFWNAGAEAIRAADVVGTNPLRIVPSEKQAILWAQIIHASNPDNQFSISFGQAIVGITFDHINKNDGVVIQLVHTGNSGAALQIQGSFVEAGRPRRVSFGGSEDDTYWNRLALVAPLLVIVAVPVVVDFLATIPEMLKTPWRSSYHSPIIERGVGGVIVLALSLLSFPRRPARGLRRVFDGSFDFSLDEAANEEDSGTPNTGLNRTPGGAA